LREDTTHPNSSRGKAETQLPSKKLEGTFQLSDNRHRKSWQKFTISVGRSNTGELEGQETALFPNIYKVLTHNSTSRNSKASNLG